MLFIKALLGFAGAGVGVFTPIAVKRLSKVVPTQVVETVSNLKVVKAVKEKIEESQKNVQVRMALNNLNAKHCKLIQNTKNLNNAFDALHACKEEGKTVFYYLSSEETFKDDFQAYISKKVNNVNYQEVDQNTAQLVLTLENGKTVNLSIDNQGTGGWAYFKNVNINDKCKLETPMLGSDILRCELQDSTNNKTFFYNFSIF